MALYTGELRWVIRTANMRANRESLSAGAAAKLQQPVALKAHGLRIEVPAGVQARLSEGGVVALEEAYEACRRGRQNEAATRWST